jgi:uncharacterized protein
MNVLRNKLRKALKTKPVRDTAHDLSHADRVWCNSELIASKEGPCDRIVLLAACYMHDLITLPKDHPERHLASQKSAAAAELLLGKLG